jgi:hypothetical protein
MARKPCKRCQQVRYTGFVIVVLLLLGYGLLKAIA